MSRARDIADLSSVSARLDTVGASSGALSNRNLVTNGSMIISQRSTSVSSQTGSGYKTVDRIYTNASGATYNQSQQTVTVGGETGLPLQFTKYLRHNVTTGNNWSQIYHKIEDVALVPEGTVTLSFYAKGTSPNAGLTFYAWQNFGSGGSSEVGISSISQTVTLTSTWQRFTVPITVPSMTGKTIGTGSHFYFGIGQGGSTSTDAWTLDITGLQLEVGDTATDFEHRSFGDELQRCQRYYQETSNATNYSMVGDGTCQTSVVSLLFDYLCEMRTSPSISALGTNGSSSWYIQSGSTTISTASSSFSGAWSAGTNSQRSWMDWSGISGHTATSTAAVYRNNQSTSNKNGCLAFDAEL